MTEQKQKTAAAIFAEYLKKTGHRRTPERFSILEEVFRHDSHFDIETLFVLMKKKNYRVSRATLYNTMELLLESGLVNRLHFGKNLSVYERTLNLNPHDHLVCTDTNETIEFSDSRIRTILEEVCKQKWMTMDRYALYVFGRKSNGKC